MAIRRNPILVAFFLVCWVVLSSGDAPAQEPPPAGKDATAEQLTERRDWLFQRMLEEPANLDIAFEYAAVSSRLRDYEAAITALERMLIFAPGLPRVQLELGVLYYRLESYETARDYFKRATSGDDVPGQVRERVAVYLEAIEERQTRHLWRGEVFGGLRFQTNANAAPGSREITLGGIEFELRDEDTKQEDYSAFLATRLRYSYDLHQQGDRFEVNTILYGAWYQEQTQVNTELVEIDFGPRIDLERYGYENSSFYPYLLVNTVRLSGETYFYTIGGGFSGKAAAGDRVILGVSASLRDLRFNDTIERPNARDKDGHRATLQFTTRFKTSARTSVSALLEGSTQNARVGYEDNREVGFGIGGSMRLGDWATMNAFASRRFTYFDEPDLIVSTKPRRDRGNLARLTLTVPLTSSVSLIAQGEYRDVKSSYDINTYDNTGATMGLSWRF